MERSQVLTDIERTTIMDILADAESKYQIAPPPEPREAEKTIKEEAEELKVRVRELMRRIEVEDGIKPKQATVHAEFKKELKHQKTQEENRTLKKQIKALRKEMMEKDQEIARLKALLERADKRASLMLTRESLTRKLQTNDASHKF